MGFSIYAINCQVAATNLDYLRLGMDQPAPLLQNLMNYLIILKQIYLKLSTTNSLSFSSPQCGLVIGAATIFNSVHDCVISIFQHWSIFNRNQLIETLIVAFIPLIIHCSFYSPNCSALISSSTATNVFANFLPFLIRINLGRTYSH